MKLEIPTHKDADFGTELFRVLSDGLTELKLENGKWPDRVQLGGQLGQEVFDYLDKSGWELSQFNPKAVGGIVNKIVIDYSKPLSQIEERGGTIFDEALGSKTLNGVPDARTMAKIQSAYSNLAYTIERTVRPSYEIKLTRKNN